MGLAAVMGVMVEEVIERRRKLLLDGARVGDRAIGDQPAEVFLGQTADVVDDALILRAAGRTQRAERFVQDGVEPLWGLASPGETLHPDAVRDQQVVERAVHRLEERPAIGAVHVVGQHCRSFIQALVGPAVVGREHDVTRFHGRAPVVRERLEESSGRIGAPRKSRSRLANFAIVSLQEFGPRIGRGEVRGFSMKKYLAEFIGTAALILIGCGAIVIGGFGAAAPIGILPIALAFGLTVMAMAYGIGPVSGCHINPAVTVGMLVAGRIKLDEALGYIVAQLLGGIAGAAVLVIVLQGRLKGYDIAAAGLGQTGWGPGYLGEFGLGAAIVTEFVATLLFIIVILGATS